MSKNEVKVLRTTWLDGPSIWTYKPAIEVTLDIQGYEQHPSNLLPGFNERLNALLPGLIEHHCGVGYRGGFCERLRDGTYAAHILEHITIELHNLIGQPIKFGKARMTSVEGVYKLVFHTTDKQVGLACFKTAHRLFQACVDNTSFDLNAELQALHKVVERHALGPSTHQIVEAARRRRIPVLRMQNSNLIQLGHGACQEQIWGAETSKTSAIADGIAGDDELCRQILSRCGVPTPDEDEVDATEQAARNHKQFYRLLMMKGQLVAASRLLPSGEVQDVTPLVHAQVERVASLAAKVVGLNIAGVDLVCEHIDQAPEHQQLAILRLACRPDLTLHNNLHTEDGRGVADMIVDSLFDADANGRIPIVTYTGGPESKGLGQAIHALLTMAGYKAGLASNKGLTLVDQKVEHAQPTDWMAGRRCLVNKQVNAAVMRVEAKTILSEGLPFDRSQVAILTSMGSRDLLAEFDIVDGPKHFNTLRTVIDVVLSQGCAILNADEVSLLPVAELCDGEVIWIAESADNPILQEHFTHGGRGAYLQGGMIHFQQGREACHRVLPLKNFNGLLTPQGALAAVATAFALKVSPELIQASLDFYFDKGWAKNPSNQRVEA